MIFTTTNSKEVFIRKIRPTDYQKLCDYCSNLSDATKKRFGPHPFDLSAIIDFYGESYPNDGYIAYDYEKEEIVAYAIVKRGYLDSDKDRYNSYNICLNQETDVTYAPSVADEWQSIGVGNVLFKYILKELKSSPARRIILWAGVQATNNKAIRYYEKNGFIKVGQFSTSVENYDMYLDLAQP